MTSEDIKQANAVILAFYGHQLSFSNPNERTVKVLATMIKETGKCSKAIAKLLDGLSSLSGPGWALKVVKAGAKLAKSDKESFRMCNAVVKNKYRSVLEITMI